MLPIIVAGSRPAATVLVQRRHFDRDTSVDLHRLLHASITETPRSRVSLASTVLLNPIGSHRLPHAQQPNRHRARGTASHIPSRDFLLWRFSNAGPSRSVRGAVRHRPASENLHSTGRVNLIQSPNRQQEHGSERWHATNPCGDGTQPRAPGRWHAGGAGQSCRPAWRAGSGCGSCSQAVA